MLSYKLSLTEKEGKVEGYSITDLGGENETKSKVYGTYNYDTKLLTLKESSIIYTKSRVQKDQFCFVSFKGKLKLTNKNVRIKSPFIGTYKNGKKCIDGQVMLIGTGTIFKLIDKVNKKIQQSKDFNEEQKTKYNATRIFDSLQTQNLGNQENLNFFTQSDSVTLVVWDNEIEDGDEISIFQNDVPILKNYYARKTRKYVKVKLDRNKSTFKIVALNQGTQGLNTVTVQIRGDNKAQFRTNLKTGESTSVTIIKSPN